MDAAQFIELYLIASNVQFSTFEREEKEKEQKIGIFYFLWVLEGYMCNPYYIYTRKNILNFWPFKDKNGINSNIN